LTSTIDAPTASDYSGTWTQRLATSSLTTPGLETELRAVMGEGHTELVRALEPLAEDGAVARFLRSLREELKGADEDRQKQLSAALAALDANDENSLLSRLVRETHRARRDVLAAVNPDAPSSPMALLKASLTKLLQDQSTAQLALAKRHEERQLQFEKEVRDALVRIETKRMQDQKTTRGGFDFEDAVIAFVRAATTVPCWFVACGGSRQVPSEPRPPKVLPGERSSESTSEARPVFSNCFLGNSRFTSSGYEESLGDTRHSSDSSEPSCAIGANCIAQQGVATPGDGGVLMTCERGQCSCHLEALTPPHTVVDFRFAAKCSSPEAMRQLILDHCLAGMDVEDPAHLPGETPNEH
jgi:hypothetical protein